MLLPLQNLMTAVGLRRGAAVLVVPYLFGRQTLGKETQHIRVIRMDGSPARFGDALRRYGMLVFAGFALVVTFLGPTGGLVAVFVGDAVDPQPEPAGRARPAREDARRRRRR